MNNLIVVKMKNSRTRIGILAIALTTLLSCGEKNSKQESKENNTTDTEQTEQGTKDMAKVSFSNDMTEKVFEDYQQLRTALVNSDSEGVQTAAGKLVEGFSEELDNMKLTALAMAEANDIEKQRHLFSKFTKKVEPMLEEAIAEGTIYKQFCPMAFQGEGGYWLSSSEKIRNPYYGDKMLKCGKIVAQIQ